MYRLRGVHLALLAHYDVVVAEAELDRGHETSGAGADHEDVAAREIRIQRGREQALAVLQEALDREAQVLERVVGREELYVATAAAQAGQPVAHGFGIERHGIEPAAEFARLQHRADRRR